jgi:hypothetical protein
MRKGLTFNLNGLMLCTEPVKIERKKLYGFSKTLVYDEQGCECESASLDKGATGVILKGGIGLGVLSPEGLWVERSTLKAVGVNGQDAPLVQSSYDSIIVLERKVTVNTLLDYCISTFYELPGEIAGIISEDIYMFDYCYRASYEPSSAFVLAAEGTAFMLTGFRAAFEMLSLPEEVYLNDDEEEIDENDEIDFLMAE